MSKSHKKCLNCNQEHGTLVMSCSKRKETLKEKRSQANERQKMYYAGISQIIPSATTIPSFQTPTITKAELLKIYIPVLLLHKIRIMRIQALMNIL